MSQLSLEARLDNLQTLVTENEARIHDLENTNRDRRNQMVGVALRLTAIERKFDPGRAGSSFSPPSAQPEASPTVPLAEGAEKNTEGEPAPAPGPAAPPVASHRGAGSLPPPVPARGFSRGQLTPSGSLRIEPESVAVEPAPPPTAAPAPAPPPPGLGALQHSQTYTCQHTRPGRRPAHRRSPSCLCTRCALETNPQTSV